MKLLTYIEGLLAKGRYTFTKQEVQKELHSTDVAIKYALYRLKLKKIIVTPVRGFYVVIPPEYRQKGCLPPEQFIDDLMRYSHAHYYVSLLNAAQLYGAAHQKPQVFQVMINQKRRNIKCGDFKIIFITKRDIEKTPTQQFKTSRGYFLASSPEATVMDLLLYLRYCAGINNVLTILTELVEEIDIKKLLRLVSSSKEIAWAQRLGVLLDFIGATKISNKLHERLSKFRLQKHFLLPNRSTATANKENNKLSSKWQILINAQLESDL